MTAVDRPWAKESKAAEWKGKPSLGSKIEIRKLICGSFEHVGFLIWLISAAVTVIMGFFEQLLATPLSPVNRRTLRKDPY